MPSYNALINRLIVFQRVKKVRYGYRLRQMGIQSRSLFYKPLTSFHENDIRSGTGCSHPSKYKYLIILNIKTAV
jgi:hypothetical protein